MSFSKLKLELVLGVVLLIKKRVFHSMPFSIPHFVQF